MTYIVDYVILFSLCISSLPDDTDFWANSGEVTTCIWKRKICMNTEKVTRGILLIYQKCRITLSLNNRSVLFVYCFGLVSAPFLLEVPTTYPLIGNQLPNPYTRVGGGKHVFTVQLRPIRRYISALMHSLELRCVKSFNLSHQTRRYNTAWVKIFFYETEL